MVTAKVPLPQAHESLIPHIPQGMLYISGIQISFANSSRSQPSPLPSHVGTLNSGVPGRVGNESKCMTAEELGYTEGESNFCSSCSFLVSHARPGQHRAVLRPQACHPGTGVRLPALYMFTALRRHSGATDLLRF